MTGRDRPISLERIERSGTGKRRSRRSIRLRTAAARLAADCRAGKIPIGSVDVVTSLADRALWVRTADLAGDGDLDLLSASRTENKIAWHLEPTDTDASHGAHNAHNAYDTRN